MTGLTQAAGTPLWMQAPAAPGTQSAQSAPPSWIQAPPAVDTATDVRESAVSGAKEGGFGLLGLAGDATTGLNNALNWGRAQLGNPPMQNITPPIPGTADIERAAGFTPYQPQTGWGHIASTGASFAPAAIAAGLTGGASAVPAALARGVAMGAATGAIGNAVADKFGEAMRPWAELGGSLLSGYGVSKVAGTVSRTATRMTAPTTKAVGDAASALYKASDNAGVLVAHTTVDGMARNAVQAAIDAGARPDLNPKTMAAIKALQTDTAAGAPMTLEDLDKERQVLDQAVKGATDQADKRTAEILSSKFEEGINGLGAGDVVSRVDPTQAVDYLNQAKGLWSAKSKGATIDKIISDAKLSQTVDKPGAYPAALQVKFRALAKDPNFSTYWTPEEQTAIITAAKGGGIGPAIIRLAGRGVGGGGLLPGFNVAGWGVSGIGNMATTNAAAYAGALARSGGTNPFTMALPLPRTGQDVATAAASGALPWRGTNPPVLPQLPYLPVSR